jgi:hypothetical protein
MKKIIVPENYKLEILDEGLYDETQQDPAWYVSGYGSTLIARITHKDGYGANIYCVGEMRYEWKDMSLRYTGAILKETEYTTDEQLNDAIHTGEIVVENNPWFESVFFDENNKEWWDFNDSVAFEINEAISLAKDLVEYTLEDIREYEVKA